MKEHDPGIMAIGVILFALALVIVYGMGWLVTGMHWQGGAALVAVSVGSVWVRR